MLRQVSSRNHRAKGGFRAKKGLQICILVAVCVWLLYQMKYSHAHRKVYEEKLRVDERQSEMARFSAADAQANQNADAKRVELRTENSKQDGKNTLPEGQEHQDQSHEERSSKGDDDPSSEEVVHNSPEAEHEERTRARERSFRADDVSSSVDHVVQVEDSESEIGVFVSSKASNSSVIRAHNQTQINIKANAEGIKGLQNAPLEKRPSSNATDEFDESVEEEQRDIQAPKRIDNETRPLNFQANESEQQIKLRLIPSDLSKNQTIVEKNYTAIIGHPKEDQKNQTTTEDRTTLHPLRRPPDPTELEISSKEGNSARQLMITNKSDLSAKPQDSRISFHNLTVEEKRNELPNLLVSYKREAAN